MQARSNLAVIQHRIDGSTITLRGSDGYVNATAACKAAGKLFADYARLGSTQDYLEALSIDMGIPISALVLTVKGGIVHEQGTWCHPKVAIHLAQWLSPKFAIAVAGWVMDWMTGSKSKPRMPYHLERYIANRDGIPHTHFSMLGELILGLVAPLESHGYMLPVKLLPDISMGRIFCKWLREEKGIDTDSLPTYEHKFDDGRTVTAKLYPIDLLGAFRVHFHGTWLPTKAVEYFRKHDPKALEYLPKVLTADRKAAISTQDRPRMRLELLRSC